MTSPAGLDFDLAAAVPCAALTGAQAIDEALQPAEGQRLLITGATGAVGLVSLFTALRRRTRVIAAVRERRVAAARAFGASETVVLGAEPWRGEGFDYVFDTVGGAAVATLCRHLKPGGRIVTVATTPIDPAGLATTPEFFAVRHDGRRLHRLLKDVAAGRLPVRVTLRLPLEKAGEAQRLVEAGGLIGKVVLVP